MTPPARATWEAAGEPPTPVPPPGRVEGVERGERVERARAVFGATTAVQRAAIERETRALETRALETRALEAPLSAFRAGWEALRARRYDDAIAAFDRATDPAVAEDAAFWAAIAAHHAGHTDDARKRLDAFLSRFPDSPRTDDARRAREVLR